MRETLVLWRKKYVKWRRKMLRRHFRARDHELLVMMQAGYRRGIREYWQSTGQDYRNLPTPYDTVREQYPENYRIVLNFANQGWEH